MLRYAPPMALRARVTFARFLLRRCFIDISLLIFRYFLLFHMPWRDVLSRLSPVLSSYWLSLRLSPFPPSSFSARYACRLQLLHPYAATEACPDMNKADMSASTYDMIAPQMRYVADVDSSLLMPFLAADTALTLTLIYVISPEGYRQPNRCHRHTHAAIHCYVADQSKTGELAEPEVHTFSLTAASAAAPLYRLLSQAPRQRRPPPTTT